MTPDLQLDKSINERITTISTNVSLDGLIATTSTPNSSWTTQIADWTLNNIEILQDESYLDFMPFSANSIDQQPVQNVLDQATTSEWLHWNLTLPNPTAPIAAPITPAISLGGQEVSGVDAPSYALQTDKVIQILRNYPALLASSDFHTPLLHRELYNMSTPEITALPRTTAAVMCALGLGNNSNTSFLRRAMSAERQRLIEGFPKYSCLEEWDTLHAMWLYETMELPDPSDMTNDDWKLGPRTRGLNLPIVLKMTRRFCQSHPEATDPTAALSNDLLTRYGTVSSVWMTWLVGETARRTVFLAHIVNYLASKDPKTDEISPYYESLDDGMIWNMPLPCSSAAWEAKTEKEWLNVLRSQHQIAGSEDQAVSLSEVYALEPTIKSLLTKFTKEQLKLQYASNVGLENSDSYRNLVVHCALEKGL